MSDTLPDVAEPLALPPPGSPPRRWGWRGQLGLRALILMVAVAALGLSIATDRRRIVDLRGRIERIRPLLHELDASDPTQFAAIELDAPWSESQSWDVYLPPGHRYQVALATRAIDGRSNWPTTATVAPLLAGRHRLTLTEGKIEGDYHFTLTEGATPILTATEPPDWIVDNSSWGSTSVGSRSGQLPTSRPLQLLRRRYLRLLPIGDGTSAKSRRTPTEPSEGLLLWIRTSPGAELD